jgi:hypothetical protein
VGKSGCDSAVNGILALVVVAVSQRLIDFAQDGSSPSTMRSGYRKSVTSTPSRRNLGFDASRTTSAPAPIR